MPVTPNCYTWLRPGPYFFILVPSCNPRSIDSRSQGLPHLQARSQQSGFHAGLGNTKYFGCFCDIYMLHIAENQYFPILRPERIHGLLQRVAQLPSLEFLRGNLPPISKFPWTVVAFFIFPFRFDGFVQMSAVLPELHARLIDRN